GGGAHGGPARSKVQHLLRERGKKLNDFAYEEIGLQMAELADRNPWHVCFAVGMSWGHLAKLDITFTEAAVNLLEHWNDDDLKVARTFHHERGPEPIEQTLRGGHTLFAKVTLPDALPDNIAGLATAQQRWLG